MFSHFRNSGNVEVSCFRLISTFGQFSKRGSAADSGDQIRNGAEKAFEEIGNRAPERHPARVDVFDRVVSDITVAIQPLRVARRRNDRIGTDEACKLWIIVSGAIVVEARLWIKYLAGKAISKQDGYIFNACGRSAP